MLRSVSVLSLLLLTSCGDEGEAPQTAWKSSYSAEECAALTSVEAITQQCGDGDFDSAAQVIGADVTQCLPYSTPAMMGGVWVRGFEYSEFFEGAKTFEEVKERVHNPDDAFTWLSASNRAQRYIGDLPIPKEGAAFRIVIIGQHSLCDFGYGHMGVASGEVIATDFISATPLPITR